MIDRRKLLTGAAAVVAYSQLAQAQSITPQIGGGIGQGFDGGISRVNGSGVVGLNLPKFKAALARGAGSPARIMIIGHSHVAAEGAGTGALGLTNCAPTGWVQQLPGNLAGKITADCNSFFGDQNAPAGSVTLANMDPRVTLAASGWVDDSAVSIMGGRFLTAASGNTGALTFTPGFTFSSAKFWYPITAGISASVAFQVNGVTQSTVNQAGSNAISSTTASVSGTSVSLINNGAATGFCSGIECFRASQQAVVSYSGWLGARITDINVNINGSPWQTLAGEQAYNADLVLVQCMVNDVEASVAAATWQTNATTLRNALNTNADVVFIIDPYCNNINFTNGLFDQYVTAAQALGQTIDMRAALGPSFAAANASGFMFDANHPNAAGHALCSQLVGGILKASV